MNRNKTTNGGIEAKRVNVGCRVVLLDLDSGEVLEYQVVSSVNSGLRAGEISLWSPVGAALLGRAEGDSIQVQAPKGTVRYRVLTITELS